MASWGSRRSGPVDNGSRTSLLCGLSSLRGNLWVITRALPEVDDSLHTDACSPLPAGARGGPTRAARSVSSLAGLGHALRFRPGHGACSGEAWRPGARAFFEGLLLGKRSCLSMAPLQRRDCYTDTTAEYQAPETNSCRVKYTARCHLLRSTNQSALRSLPVVQVRDWPIDAQCLAVYMWIA